MGQSLHILFDELAKDIQQGKNLDFLNEDELKDDDTVYGFFFILVNDLATEKVNAGNSDWEDVSFGDVAKVARSLQVSYKTGHRLKNFK